MTDEELQAARFNLRFQFVAQDLLGSDQEVNGWFQEYDQGVAVQPAPEEEWRAEKAGLRVIKKEKAALKAALDRKKDELLDLYAKRDRDAAELANLHQSAELALAKEQLAQAEKRTAKAKAKWEKLTGMEWEDRPQND
jgi:septal ring factor EnvC (AmiA/AmiB activator)